MKAAVPDQMRMKLMRRIFQSDTGLKPVKKVLFLKLGAGTVVSCYLIAVQKLSNETTGTNDIE